MEPKLLILHVSCKWQSWGGEESAVRHQRHHGTHTFCSLTTYWLAVLSWFLTLTKPQLPHLGNGKSHNTWS